MTAYLEEEVRKEALVRKMGDFARTLELAANESGNIMNFNRLSQDIGIAQTTVTSYYQILEDCLIIERIEPYLSASKKTRRRLNSAAKYIFFDLGVRRLAAGEGTQLPEKIMGELFEQFIGLEILHTIRNQSPKTKLMYWRDYEGKDVDWVIVGQDRLIPIEVKWTHTPTISDARHLHTFCKDYDVQHAYAVCRCDKPIKLSEQVIALPWQDLVPLLNRH